MYENEDIILGKLRTSRETLEKMLSYLDKNKVVDYTTQTGFVFEKFQNASDWSIDTGTFSADTINFIEGNQSIKVTPTVGGASAITKIIDISSIDTVNQDMALDVYLYSDPIEYTNIWLYFSSVSGVNTYMSLSRGVNTYNLKKGWNRLLFNNLDWIATSDAWTNHMIRLRVRFSAQSGKQPSMSFGALRMGYKGKAKCLIEFDACYDSAYTEGYTYAKSKGIKGSTFVYPEMINTVGKVTSGQLATMYSNGWDVGIYPVGWISAGVLDTVATAQAEVARCKAWLDSSGYDRASDHVVYPNGAYNDNALTALSNLKIKTGRASEGYQYLPLSYNPYRMTRYVISSATSLDTAKGHIDEAIKFGIPVLMVFHTFSAMPTGNDWSIANYQALIDYIATKVTSGDIECQTISEFYNGLNE